MEITFLDEKVDENLFQKFLVKSFYELKFF
jgi:hypothetical protein